MLLEDEIFGVFLRTTPYREQISQVLRVLFTCKGNSTNIIGQVIVVSQETDGMIKAVDVVVIENSGEVVSW